MKQAIRTLAALLAAVVVVGGFWFGGFNFDTRGPGAFYCYALSLIAFVVVYFYPGWREA